MEGSIDEDAVEKVFLGQVFPDAVDDMRNIKYGNAVCHSALLECLCADSVFGGLNVKDD